MPSSRTRRNRTLATIAREIRALEKRGIRDIVEIGKLLHEAEQKCEHGKYLAWIVDNFDFSHDTSLNYRAAFELSKNPNGSDFRTWNISMVAFYRIARMMKGDKDDVRAAKEVIKVAKKRRVSSGKVSEIIYSYRHRRSDDPDSPPADLPAVSHPPAAAHEYDVVVDPVRLLLCHVDHVVDTDVVDTDVVVDVQQEWKRSVRAEAEQAIETIEDLLRDYLDLGKFEAPPDLVSVVSQAADCWIKLRARLDKSSSVKAKADRAEAKSKPRSGGGHDD
jgi:hypothetical protein